MQRNTHGKEIVTQQRRHLFRRNLLLKAESLKSNRAFPKALPYALLFGTSLALASCQTGHDITGSTRTQSLNSQTDQALHAYADTWRQRYEANPDDKQAAINYARALRNLTQYSQAAAILQGTAIKYPADLMVLGEYGKALVDAGRFKEASEILMKAHHPENPNWTILSAQGVVADQLGNHTEAQNFYLSALKIVQGEPSVLSNLAMSYVLTKQPALAETTLKQAMKDPRADLRVRQNLVFVLALQGKYQEANLVANQGLSAQDSEAIVSSVRAMLANRTASVAPQPQSLQPAQNPTSQISQDSPLQNFDLPNTPRNTQNKAKPNLGKTNQKQSSLSLTAPATSPPTIIQSQDFVPKN